MKRIYITTLMMVLCTFSLFAGEPYQDSNLSIDERVEDLLGRMTLEEKADYISGMRIGSVATGPTAWDGTKGNERLGITPMKFYCGPYGAATGRYVKKQGVYYPSSINMAASWNRELVQEIMTSLSKEVTYGGGQSNAGLAMNIIRDLRGGRSMEYFTEDPYLNGEIAVANSLGVQSQNNIAIVKHYICNNQERRRNGIDARVGERALREIYLPGYKAAIERGGAMAVMTGYNRINGDYCAASNHLINEILKGEWGFKGVVMTDWMGYGDDAVSMINAGLDLEMPRPIRYNKESIIKLVKDGVVSESKIDEQMRRILYLTFWCGVMDRDPKDLIDIDKIGDKESIAVARKAAEESIVLLKNEGNLLPFNRNEVKKIAVIGPNGEFGVHFREGAKTYQMLQGGGSASIVPMGSNLITPFVGIKNAAKNIDIAFEPGCYGELGYTPIKTEFFKSESGSTGLDAQYFQGNSFEGKAQVSVDQQIKFKWNKTPVVIEQEDETKANAKQFSAKWSGKLVAPESCEYGFEFAIIGGGKLYIDNELVIDYISGIRADKYAVGKMQLTKGEHDIRVEYSTPQGLGEISLLWNYGGEKYLNDAIALAKSSDVVVMTVGTSGDLESEATDRCQWLDQSDCISLSTAQERLIKEVAKVNKNVVVVTYTAGVVCEAWRDDVSAIIYAGFPGEQGANALGDILFGDVNPSAKLTVSIPKSSNQYPKDYHSLGESVTYNEGIFVGYRYFDKHKLEPAFPFGHGLSYTTFKYGDAKVKKSGDKWSVSIPVTNSGDIAGKEVVQLYVSDLKCSEERPLKELKGFEKIDLKAGETKVVNFTLDDEAFAFWSEKSNDWRVEAGEFKISIGASSKDLRSSVKIKMSR